MKTKFKVLDVNKNTTHLVSKIHFADDGYAETVLIEIAPKPEFFNPLVDGESGTLLPFTGEVDKHGNEIYQGDTVKCGYGTGEVVYMCGCWMVRWIDDPEANMEFLGLNKTGRRKREDDEQFEIIPNEKV